MATTGPPGQGAGGGRIHRAAPPNRRDRAKARTRTALIQAAQRLIVEGQQHAPILEITQAADVGLGSFYNHFESRDALFAAATEEALESVGLLLDQLSAGLPDPAEVFAQGFRLTGRLFRSEPLLMQVALSRGPALLQATRGLVPRARRDLNAGICSGRFTVRDTQVALAIVVGTALCVGELLRDQPTRDAGATADTAAAALLRALGLSAEDAERIAAQPLPRLDVDFVGGQRTPSRRETQAVNVRSGANH
ncbi:MAG: TetR/AcrR family transcriptional regulator [Candidatus Dormibacteraeota bacterium]|nr:TetR/AcrR family transcriptional regulator [Candidatus Dormibacteraeota bacterium]